MSSLKFKYTGAHWAVKKNNLTILKMFVHAGIDLNVTSHNGGTLLHLGTGNKCGRHEKIVHFTL